MSPAHTMDGFLLPLDLAHLSFARCLLNFFNVTAFRYWVF